MWREFKAFLVKENVLALAIAVSALVADFIMPIVTFAVPGGAWRSWTLDAGPVKFAVGDFIGALIDFLIIGFVVWRISKAFIRPKAAGAVRSCPYCVMAIDPKATRCPHCTSQVTAQ